RQGSRGNQGTDEADCHRPSSETSCRSIAMANEKPQVPTARQPAPGIVGKNPAVLEEPPGPAVTMADLENYIRLQKMAREKYLQDSGWVRSAYADKWMDPRGKVDQRGEMRDAAVIPTRGGGSETIQQMTMPPLAWPFPLDQ